MINKSRIFLRVFSILALVGLSGTAVVWAQAPNSMTYAGVLTDAKSVPLDGQYNITFRVFGAPTGGTPLYEQALNGVVVRGGQFNVLLSGLGDGLFAQGSGDRFVEIQIGSDPPLLPRQPLISVPFAVRAKRTDSAANADNAQNAVNAQNATNAQNAVNAQNATRATSAANADNAQNAVNAQNAARATSAGRSDTSGRADSAARGDTAGRADSAARADSTDNYTRFGGVYTNGPRVGTCNQANPMTGRCSCPSGYTPYGGPTVVCFR